MPVIKLMVVTIYFVHAFWECAKILHLSSEYQVSKLGVGKENNKEHDCKSSDVLGTARERGLKLGHSAIKTK